MKVADWTPEQLAAFTAYDRYLRGTTAQLMRLAKDADPSLWAEFAKQSIDEVLGATDVGAMLPQTSDLALAKPLSREEFLRLQALMRQLVELAEAERSLIVKAVGVNA